MFASGIASPSDISLKACDTANVDDVGNVAAICQKARIERLAHAGQPKHIGLVHIQPLIFVHAGDRLQAQRTPGVVDENLNTTR